VASKRPGRRRAGGFTVARVLMWGREVGAVAEDSAGQVVFEYTDDFRSSGLEISPLRLPLALRGPVSFPELSRVDSFAGLPGVLADCLPDAFGNAVIQRYFEERGTPEAALSPVQKLLYIGGRGMGALEFSPPLRHEPDRRGEEALHIAELVQAARRVLQGDAEVVLPEMMRVGASAGGARAKALVLWNEQARRLKSAFATHEEGDEDWLIKFDGVTAGGGGHDAVRSFEPGPFGRIEYAYSRMAKRAGIRMTDTYLLRERDFAHFMTRRFDRDRGQRIHMHSLGGLHHADYNIRQVLSYEEYFRTIRVLGMGQPDVDEAFRRMVFNIAARNQDDHVKNFAFLMDPDGRWRLSPAFDVIWACGGRWAKSHQMTAGGKDDRFTRDDLIGIAERFDVARNGLEIIDAVDAALDTWAEEAGAAGLDSAWAKEIAGLFRRFAAPRSKRSDGK
jgi:serine/threonine-protein kinase HipA